MLRGLPVAEPMGRLLICFELEADGIGTQRFDVDFAFTFDSLAGMECNCSMLFVLSVSNVLGFFITGKGILTCKLSLCIVFSDESLEISILDMFSVVFITGGLRDIVGTVELEDSMMQ